MPAAEVQRDDHLPRALRRWVAIMERRYRRVFWLLIGAILLIVLGTGGALLSIRAIQRDQDLDRWRATYSGCLGRNAASQANLDFLDDLHVSPSTRRKAAKRYPLEPNCKDYVRRLYGGETPEGAFDVPPPSVRPEAAVPPRRR